MVKDAIAELRLRFNDLRGTRPLSLIAEEIPMNRMSLSAFATGGRISIALLERLEAWMEQQETQSGHLTSSRRA